jgi:hypothetical protein
LKQKKQKFKSTSYASLPHKAIALQSGTAPLAVYILPFNICRLHKVMQNLKGPRLAHSPPCAARFRPKLGDDK